MFVLSGQHGAIALQHVVLQRNRDCEVALQILVVMELIALQLIQKIAIIQSATTQAVKTAVRCGRHGHHALRHVVAPQQRRDCEYVQITIPIVILLIL